jgi:hypothetical protein
LVVHLEVSRLAGDDFRSSGTIHLKVPGTEVDIRVDILTLDREAYAGAHGEVSQGHGKTELATGGVPIAIILGSDEDAVEVEGRIVVAGGAKLGGNETTRVTRRLG